MVALSTPVAVYLTLIPIRPILCVCFELLFHLEAEGVSISFFSCPMYNPPSSILPNSPFYILFPNLGWQSHSLSLTAFIVLDYHSLQPHSTLRFCILQFGHSLSLEL